jgi:acyl-CoA synthetase (AMP-forming)/AMP-acid ligase II
VIDRYRVTRTLLVPAVILLLLDDPGIHTTNLSSLQLMFYGASPIPIELLRKALDVFKCDFIQFYGPTETGGGITYLGAEEHGDLTAERLLSCGRPKDGVEIRIVNALGEPLPPRQVGEIICRSAQVMKGYWNLPEETVKVVKGEWLYTGDAGYLDEAGFLYIHDRVKDMIVSGDENIYPAEVESAL